MKYLSIIKYTLGWIEIWADDQYVIKIRFIKTPRFHDIPENHITQNCASQINEYLLGKRKEFDCPVKLFGTEFQMQVWNVTRQIPYGKTISYKDLAIIIGKPNSARAVANALKLNRLPIIIPCHRVIRSNGQLGGFYPDIEIKKFLLQLEKMTN